MTGILEQAFKWLSLLGGLHCLVLGLYLRYLYRSASDCNRLLAGIILLLAMPFFSGLLSRESLTLPMPLIYALFIPGYFLLMPMLYQYCRLSLSKSRERFWFHYLPVPLIAIWVAIDQWRHPGLLSPIAHDRLTLADYTPLLAILTPLLFIQSAIYYLLIFRWLIHHRGRGLRSHETSLRDIRFRWLVTLCLALMFNWLIQVLVTLFPIYFGSGASELMLVLPDMVLLLSLYALAFYGLKQITHAAYLRGKLSLPPKVSHKASSQLLSAEELSYLQSLLEEEQK